MAPGQGDERMVPIAFQHAPSAPKPPKDATPQQQREHHEANKQRNLNAQSVEHMQRLRDETAGARAIVFSGDGSYTNKSVLRGLPAGCTYLGRMRKDAVLHYPPSLPPQSRQADGPAMERQPTHPKGCAPMRASQAEDRSLDLLSKRMS